MKRYNRSVRVILTEIKYLRYYIEFKNKKVTS